MTDGMLGRAPQATDGLLDGIPRAAFMPEAVRGLAGQDAPVPIGAGQTTSQPSMVAKMVRALGLTGRERVLEIGGGTGFAATVLARKAREVYTVERMPELAAQATAILGRQGVDNVQVVVGDGSKGLPQFAPYEAILVSAASPQVPAPLLAQLAIGGRLVVPIGTEEQRLVRIIRVAQDRFQQEDLGPVQFVPLVSNHEE